MLNIEKPNRLPLGDDAQLDLIYRLHAMTGVEQTSYLNILML